MIVAAKSFFEGQRDHLLFRGYLYYTASNAFRHVFPTKYVDFSRYYGQVFDSNIIKQYIIQCLGDSFFEEMVHVFQKDDLVYSCT